MLLAFIGVTDLVGASINERTALEYWLSNVPIRLFFLFGMTGYVYLCKEGGLLGPSALQPAGIGEPLQNSLVFTFGFVEIAMWFWVWPDSVFYRHRGSKADLDYRSFPVCKIKDGTLSRNKFPNRSQKQIDYERGTLSKGWLGFAAVLCIELVSTWHLTHCSIFAEEWVGKLKLKN